MNAPLLRKRQVFDVNNEDIYYGGQAVLREINLSVSRGEKIAVVGRSGAGKTTLLRRLFQIERNCSFIHQHYSLVPQLSTFHNIYMGRLDYYSGFHNLANLIKPLKIHVKEIMPIAETLGLADKLFTRIGELSGGQQQRVGIGRAFYHGGDTLLADEPVSSLDSVQGERIIKLITNTEKTVVSSLHSIDLSVKYFDRIVGLKNHGIFFDLPAEKLGDALLADLYE